MTHPIDFYPPREIIDAAQKVEDYFKKHHVLYNQGWEFMGICSRDHAYKLQAIKRLIEKGEDSFYEQ